MKRTHALALLTAMLASAALAREPPENEPPSADDAVAGVEAAEEQPLEFSSLDANDDTTISRDEARSHAGLRAIFAECDVDHNGSLNTWEFAEAMNRLER